MSQDRLPMKRIVCFLNQFFGQIGGEDKASCGFILKNKPIGPAVLFNTLLREEGKVVGTLICGDNYFVENPEKSVREGLALIESLKPDLFFAGPAFNAGRYGLSCGHLASAVAKKLNIPTVTGMYPENPAVELFRKDTYIVKTGIHAMEMRKAVPAMVHIGRALLNGESLGNASEEGYIIRDIIQNEMQEKNAGNRAIDMLLAKIHGEPFESELLPPVFETEKTAPPVADITKAKIAFITDGGLIPENNPDKLKPNASSTYGVYNREKLFSGNYFVIHSGYDGTWVMENPKRLFPDDVAEELVEEGKIGSIDENVYVVCGNCASISVSKRLGSEIAVELLNRGVEAAILTST